MAVPILLALQFLSARASTELVSYISICTMSHSLLGTRFWVVAYFHRICVINDIV